MKFDYFKKIFFTLLICFCGILFIDAETPSKNIIPKVNDSGFNVGDKIDFKVSEPYDFSLISFSTDSAGKTIQGKSDMKKIYSGTLDNHFTAYCMDGNKKYPEYEYLADNLTSSQLIKYMTIFEILKECNTKESCTLFDNVQGITGYDISNIDEASSEMLTKFDNDETVTMTLSSIAFATTDGSAIYYNANDLGTALSIAVNSGKISVNFKKSDFLVNHYTASTMPDTIGYKKALWIIEHSYPTLELEEFLNYAGVDIDALMKELLKALRDKYPNSESVSVSASTINKSFFDRTMTIIPNSTSDVNINLEDYVYGTIQYAIWQVIGDYYELDGTNKLHLGTTLNGSEELNKLYNYLIKDRESYIDDEYTANLYLEIPENESYKSESNAEYYGPYKIKSKMLITNWNSLTATLTTPKSGVTLVNKDLESISSSDIINNSTGEILSTTYQLSADENKDYAEFYIKIDNSAKDTTAINIKLNGTGKVYNTDSNRGRLFYSESALDQVVAASARIVDVTATNEVKLEFNAKTGDFAFGTILLALLGAFTVGYLALRFKGDPISNIN